jgi:hypothetical protein
MKQAKKNRSSCCWEMAGVGEVSNDTRKREDEVQYCRQERARIPEYCHFDIL